MADNSLFEVIVIDDGSTDSSAAIAQTFSARYANLTYLHQDNAGVSVARMRGVSLAKGDYIWFIDSDDYLVANAIDEVLSIINHYQDVDVFVTPMCLVTDAGKQIGLTNAFNSCFTTSGKALLKDKGLFLTGLPHFIVKHSLFENKWLFFPVGVRYEDEYFARVLKYMDGQFMVLDKPLYYYRQWEGSYMNTVQVGSMQDIISIYEYLDRYAFTAVSAHDMPWFRNNIMSFLLESYTRCSNSFGSKEFEDFRKNNEGFIQGEWLKYRQYFTVKDRILGRILLANPLLYRFLIHVNNRRKQLLPTVK